MAWNNVATISQIPLGGMLQVNVNEDDIAIYHTEEGLYATSDLCTHARAYLTDGKLDGCIVTCPKHGGKFDVRTGAAAAFPCVIPVETYSVELRGEEVWLDY